MNTWMNEWKHIKYINLHLNKYVYIIYKTVDSVGLFKWEEWWRRGQHHKPKTNIFQVRLQMFSTHPFRFTFIFKNGQCLLGHIKPVVLCMKYLISITYYTCFFWQIKVIGLYSYYKTSKKMFKAGVNLLSQSWFTSKETYTNICVYYNLIICYYLYKKLIM